ncbi:unnamed protein product [Ectocarpus sp. 12 AP-2014]
MNLIENVQGEVQDAENALLLDGTPSTTGSEVGAAATSVSRGLNKGDRVRRRLSVCLFLHIVGVAIISQVYPKVVLEHFDHDNGEASRFTGWLTLVSCIVQLIAIPTLCGASDVIGRRAILAGSLALTAVSSCSLGLAPSSITVVSVCQVVSGVANAILPISQAIIIDLSHWGAAAGGGEVTHGLGLIGAAFGLAVSVGPVLGGSLTEDHAGTACWLSASMSLLGVLSLKFFGWEETAPAAAQGARGAAANTSAGGRWKKLCARGSSSRIVNPFSVLKVFLESSQLMQLAVVLACFSLSLNVFSVYYNYFDFRYHWSPLDISLYFSTFGILLALTSGILIRFLVPKRLSMGRGVLLGLALQSSSTTLFGLASQGWMCYVVLVATVLQYITEPCIQGVMANHVGADRQGSLQGAVQCLRNVSQGLAGVLYGQIFSLGVSTRVEKALGFVLPGLPLFCASGCGAAALAIAWYALRKAGETGAADPKSTANPSDVEAEEGWMMASSTVDVTDSSTATPAEDSSSDGGRSGKENLAASPTALMQPASRMTGLGDKEDTMSDMSKPLLPRGDRFDSRSSS